MTKVKIKHSEKKEKSERGESRRMQSKEAKMGMENHHVKVPLDSKSLLKMHISHAIMSGLMKVK